MELKDILSLVFSAIALLGTLFTYFFHNRKLSIQQKQINEQQKLINEYQLRAMEEEGAKKKKAFIQCEIFPNLEKGILDKMRIRNIGSSVANNVNFKDQGQIYYSMPEDLFPYPKLLPGQYIELLYYSGESNNIHQTITFTWDDEMKKGESCEQVVIL